MKNKTNKTVTKISPPQTTVTQTTATKATKAISKKSPWLSNLSLTLLSLLVSTASLAQKPNIVLMVQDNLGWGEVGTYGGGILRGAATPNIDQLAAEGLKLTNFNVEAQCVPSRSALMTGRHPIRSGTHSVVWGMLYGMTQWEITLPEVLAEQGYATAMYGKWHLGDTEGRFPTDQGFDEWYGIPNTTDEATYTEGVKYDKSVASPSVIMKSTKGKTPSTVKVYDRQARAEIDNDLTDMTITFMKQQTKKNKPFFAYVPYTLPHIPAVPSKQFEGKTGNGRWADMLANMDYNVGRVLKAIDDLNIRDNTIVIWMSENGPEEIWPHHGTAGPWRGTYFTPYEGGLRTPFIVRWPDNIKAGDVSNEIVHITDIFPTLAAIVGANMPQDRIIDGVNQTPLFIDKTQKSAREGFPIYNGATFYGYKWREWKVLIKTNETMGANIKTPGMPRLYHIPTDMKEQYDLVKFGGKEGGERHYWVMPVIFKKIVAHQGSLIKEPPIKMGTPDPYIPAQH